MSNQLRVFMPSPNEGWIGDITTEEFENATTHRCVRDIRVADVVWMYSKWIANHFPIEELKKRPCITTVHHIVPSKGIDIAFFDSFTDVYHVPNDITMGQLRQLTKKPIIRLPYWVPTAIEHMSIEESIIAQASHSGKNRQRLYSFQRDTEGATINYQNPLPKLEKGPDIFVNVAKGRDDYYVCLGGWRRQYIQKQLPAEQWSYGLSYGQKLLNQDIDKPALATHEDVNVLYNILRQQRGIYLITSRHEGGPQAVLEASKTMCRILSTNVGIASEVLHPYCIIGDAPGSDDVRGMQLIVEAFRKKIDETSDEMWNEIVEFNARSVEKLSIENVIVAYDKAISEVHDDFYKNSR